MITVTLSHPNGQRQEVLLAGVPRKGDHIRLTNGVSPSLEVLHVLWLQGTISSPEPDVIVVVQPHSEGLRV